MRRAGRAWVLVLATALSFVAAPHLHAEALGGTSASALSEWFDVAPEARAYVAVRERVLTTAQAVLATGVPLGPLFERLKEGVSKRIPPERLAAALEEEAVRLGVLVQLLMPRKLSDGARASLLSEGSILLRAGTSSSALAASLDVAGPGEEGARRAFAAESTLLGLRVRHGLDAALSQELALALVRSSMRRERFSSLQGLFAQWRARGQSSERIARAMIDIFESGVALAGLERELERRLR